MSRECESPIVERTDEVRQRKGERRTWLVVALTLVMMVAEIGFGWAYGSMSLVADGWHMGSHVAALSITLFAYWHARRHRHDPKYSFGTGKVGALGGFASGATLGFVALMLVAECIEKLVHPDEIHFEEALLVAGVGLAANLLSAFLLSGTSLGDDGHGHAHGHAHGHGTAREEHGHDHNLRAAYLHVLADALTSVLAILALLGGRQFGWTALDPLVGIVACIVIVQWTVTLLRQSAVTLLDQDRDPSRTATLRTALERELDVCVVDLHVWTAAPGVEACMATLASPSPDETLRARAREVVDRHGPFEHLTVEVRPPR